jgi:hypothetical protein
MNDELLRAGLMASLLEGGGLDSKRPLTADEFKAIRGKITDLKVGEELRYLGAGGYKIPKKGDTVVVASLDVPDQRQEDGRPIHRNDFTSFFKDTEGELIEFALNSLHFERV